MNVNVLNLKQIVNSSRSNSEEFSSSAWPFRPGETEVEFVDRTLIQQITFMTEKHSRTPIAFIVFFELTNTKT